METMLMRIKKTLRKRGMSQAELAKQMHCNPVNLNRKLNGHICFKAEDLVLICKILNVSADYILFGPKGE